MVMSGRQARGAARRAQGLDGRGGRQRAFVQWEHEAGTAGAAACRAEAGRRGAFAARRPWAGEQSQEVALLGCNAEARESTTGQGMQFEQEPCLAQTVSMKGSFVMCMARHN